jgi:U4/U6.U5 tri-snRNP-associated protein 2
VEKRDLIEKILQMTQQATKYNLIANICHDSPITKGKETARQTNPLTEGSYRVHVQNRVCNTVKLQSIELKYLL